jgi:hypothetical protein
MFEEGTVIAVTKHLSVFSLLTIHQVLLFTFLDIQAPHLFDIQIVSKVFFYNPVHKDTQKQLINLAIRGVEKEATWCFS